MPKSKGSVEVQLEYCNTTYIHGSHNGMITLGSKRWSLPMVFLFFSVSFVQAFFPLPKRHTCAFECIDLTLSSNYKTLLVKLCAVHDCSSYFKLVKVLLP